MLTDLARRRFHVQGEMAGLGQEKRAEKQLLDFRIEADPQYGSMDFDDRLEVSRNLLCEQRLRLEDELASVLIAESPGPGPHPGAIDVRDRLGELERREALLEHIAVTEGASIDELDAVGAGFVVLDDGFSQAFNHHFSGDGSDAILGAETRNAIINSDDMRKFVNELQAGQHFGGDPTYPDLEWEWDGERGYGTWHVGNIPVHHETICRGGSCTTTFTAKDDGIRDILFNVDKGGPRNEIPGAVPYRYRPFSWTETFTDPRGVLGLDLGAYRPCR